jgi:hypothetical protein
MSVLGVLTLIGAINFFGFQGAKMADWGEGDGNRSSQDTHCEPALPIQVKLVPLDSPAVGRTTRFQVVIDSRLDPDFVREIRMEYELPPQVRRPIAFLEKPEVLRKSGHSRLELGLIIPDESCYEIRARVIVILASGRTISQSAVHWVDLGEEDAPEGLIKRLLDKDGTGIRVYRGVRVDNR